MKDSSVSDVSESKTKSTSIISSPSYERRISNNSQLQIPSSLWWTSLAVVLFLATFGVIGSICFLFYVILFIGGLIAVFAKWSIEKSNEKLASDDTCLLDFEDPYWGLPSVFKKIEVAPQSFKCDKRLTGSSCIDEVLQEVIQYFFRDYIHYWYFTISDDERFLHALRQTIQKTIITFASRSKDVDWVPFLTTRLVDDFAMHLKIFRITKERLARKNAEKGYFNSLTPEELKAQGELDLETVFFDVESEIEKDFSRKAICWDDEMEQSYLQDITEVLLFLLLPPEDFKNHSIRCFLREVIAQSVILPTVNMICDPDYVNQTISWLCEKETTFTVESFLTTIRLSDDVEDIEETKKRVDLEIAKLRAHDSEVLDTNQSEITGKKQLSSLMYVRKLCITTIRRLKSGNIANGFSTMDVESDPNIMEFLPPQQSLPRLPLKDILDDNTALSYFIEFMGTYNAEHYIFFYLTVEGFRATAIQQLSILAEETTRAVDQNKANPTSENFEQLKQAAANIYEEYISPKASPRIVLDDQLVRKIVKDIKSSEPSGAYFDSAHVAVYKILESQKYYGAFLNSTAYLKCLVELELVQRSERGHSFISSEDDNLSLAGSHVSSLSDKSRLEPQQQWTPDCDLRYSALIGQAAISSDGVKQFAVYIVHVCRTTSDGSRNWTVIRRYSDFHDLHMQLREKFPSLSWLNLPGKKTFGNMDEEFIEKRKNALEDYLQPLLDTVLLSENPGMFELVAGFLEEGEYFKGKSVFSRKFDHIVNPMKTSINNVSRAVKTKADSVSRWSGDIGEKLSSRNIHEREEALNAGKLSDALDSEGNENIPLRILLLLMDEVFDLKQRNQWLRRRVVAILRQIIKATFGDRINRKIVDYVDFATNSQQIAEYLKSFRDAYWPNGVLAEEAPARESDVRRRMRMVTKAKMIGSIPDDLRRFLGQEATREGISRVFDMFQHMNLNKRLCYVMFEAFLGTLFPDNKFKEIFKKIHSKKLRT